MMTKFSDLKLEHTTMNHSEKEAYCIQNLIAKYYPKLLEAQYLVYTLFENVNTEFVVRSYTFMILFKKLCDSISLIYSDACMENSRTYSYQRNFHVRLPYL